MLDEAARSVVPDPDARLSGVIRRGSRRRAAGWIAAGTAAAVFLVAVLGTAIVLRSGRTTGTAAAGSLATTGWTMRYPSGWHVQRLPACPNAPDRTGVIVSNVAYGFTDPDGRPPGCEDRLIHPGFPANGIAVALTPVGIRTGIFPRGQPTPFPVEWSQLQVASPGIEGPRASYLGLVVDGAPVLYLRTWVGEDVSAEAVRQARDVVASVRVSGGASWTTYHDPVAGFTIDVPTGWRRRPSEPGTRRAVGAIAMFPIQPMTGVCQAPFPVSLVGMGEGDVAIAIGGSPAETPSAALRPPAFGPDTGRVVHLRTCQVEGGSLVEVGYRFRDAGAVRAVDVAFGARAWMDGQLKRLVWTILDGLRFGPTAAESPPSSVDVGLDHRLCDAASVTGDVDGDGAADRVTIGAIASPDGACPTPGRGRRVLVVDLASDGRPDVESPAIDCSMWCVPFAAADLNGDGIAEILVDEGHLTPPVSAVIAVYELRDGRIVPVSFPDGSNRFPLVNSWQGYDGAYCGPGSSFTTWRGPTTEDGGSLRTVVYRSYALDVRTLSFSQAGSVRRDPAGRFPSRTGWDRLCGVPTTPFG